MASASGKTGDPVGAGPSRFRVAVGLLLVAALIYLLDDSRSNAGSRRGGRDADDSPSLVPGGHRGPVRREGDSVRHDSVGGHGEVGKSVDGLPEGEWTTYHEGGAIESRRTYVRGALDGIVESWYPGGARRSRTEWRAGLKHGLEAVWTESGVAILEGRNEGGRRTGRWTWRWPNGNLLEEGEYGPEGRVGVWRKYFENGRVQGEGRFAGETPIAPWKVWDPEGRLLTERFDPAVLK